MNIHPIICQDCGHDTAYIQLDGVWRCLACHNLEMYRRKTQRQAAKQATRGRP